MKTERNYRDMYYHLAGRMATAVELLESTVKVSKAATDGLESITNSLKRAQSEAEDTFIDGDFDGTNEGS
ncbi:MAG: hypothetical protein LBR54_02380 [Oscillospiraceae bacterium]|nr:hypothetical protein [Oscillospiraceae bacterium]